MTAAGCLARPAPGPRHIVVLALRRSGTTALWRLLRQDPRHSCYDEPFSPLLHRLPDNNAKGTWDEFIALRARDPDLWSRHFAPVARAGELHEVLTPDQAAYLRFLAADGPVVIDETRATARLPAIRAALGDALFVHLFRHPVAFASSHMIASQNPRALRQHLHRTAFFRRPVYFDAWGMEAFWRPALRADTHAWLAAEGVVPPAVRAPAVHKLLALWLASYRRLERDGGRLGDAQFLSLDFEAFCAAPRRHLDDIYARAGRAPFSFDRAALHPARPGYRAGDPRWRAAAVAVGFTAAELARFFPTGAR